MSLDLDMAVLLSTASQIINGFWPLIALVGGLTIGFALVKGIPQMLKSVI